MLTAEQNYRLLQEIDASRRFLLLAYRQNPTLLEHAAPEILRLCKEAAPGGIECPIYQVPP